MESATPRLNDTGTGSLCLPVLLNAETRFFDFEQLREFQSNIVKATAIVSGTCAEPIKL